MVRFMAGRGGYRPGAGGPKGPRKATIERALIAQRAVAESKESGKPLAKDVLEDFMHLFAGMAAHHQPMPEGQLVPPGRKPDVAKFLEYAKLATDVAKALAPYQSPTFRAIVVSANPGDARDVPGSRPANIIPMDTDAIGAARVYRKIITSSVRRA